MQNRWQRLQFLAGLLALTLPLAFAYSTSAQVTTPAIVEDTQNAAQVDESEEDKQDRLVAERFQELLIKRPRPGTALDKVYEFHLQRENLDKYCADLQMYAKANSHGASWLLHGLVLQQRGQESDAIASFQKAEELLTEDAMASYYYAKALALVGNAEQAVAAMNRAIERKPSKSELLVVLQDLGRLYQRMGRAQEATEVWKNLETSFPADARVKEQIAAILAEEGATVDALARYEELIEATRDRYRKVELSLFAAQLKETLGRRDDALADFERLLGQVNPDSWIHQDLRGRIDRSFTSRNDYDGLAKYYQRWVEEHPDDVDAMLRVGRFLSMQRRTPEAKEWFSKAMERAPSNPAPRLALVDILEREKQFTEAAQTLNGVVELEPDNVDHIIRLGRLTYADPDVQEVERARSAAKIWSRLLETRGDDALTVSRVGDLLASVNLVDDAIAAFRKAIELAENEPQYREYLGEYLFKLDRKDEALAIWRELASGPRENRDNLVRLSEVLGSFHLDEEALSTMARACRDKPTFDHRIAFTKMLRRAKKFDDAVTQIDLAASLAESANEQSTVIEQQVETYQASGQLAAKIAELEVAVAGAEKDNSVSWQKLALFFEAERKFSQATMAIEHAIELTPQSAEMSSIQARLLEKAGLYTEAIETLRKLAALDRRQRSNYLMQIATLQMRVGQHKAAVETGRELVAGAANSEQLKFFADLCFRTGQDALGLETLQRNVRRNPNDRDALRSLASQLALNGQDAAAMEFYWRSFSASTSMDERRNEVLALTQLYKRKDQMQLLLDRLGNLGRERGDHREATLLMATAKQAVGDLAGARTLLESLVTEDSRDVEVLMALIQFAATESDWDSAIRFQRRLNASAPSTEGELRLAKFLVEKGEVDEPLAIWAKHNRSGSSSDRIVQIMDLLFKNRQKEKAIEYARKEMDQDPDNWELLATVMVCMWRNMETDRAIEVAERLMKKQLPFDTPSAQYQKRLANAVATGTSPNGSVTQKGNLSSRIDWLERFSTNGVSLLYQMSSPNSFDSYGDARLLARFLKEHGASVARNINGNTQINFNRIPTSNAKISDVATLKSAEEIWELIGIHCCVGRIVGISGSESFSLDKLLNRLIELGDHEAPRLLLESRFFGRLAGRESVVTSIGPPRSRTSWIASLSAPPRAAVTFSANGRVKTKPVALPTDELDRLRNLYEQTVFNSQSATEQIAYLLWLAEEYRISYRESGVAPLMTRAKALVEQNPSKEQFIAFIPFDRQYALDKFADCFGQPSQAASVRSNVPNGNAATVYAINALYSVSGFLDAVFKDSATPTEIASLCSAIKESQLGEIRKLTPSQLAVYDPKVAMRLMIYTTNSPGGRPANVFFPVLSESAFQTTDMVTALFFIHVQAEQAIKDAVGQRLADEAEAPDDDVLRSAVDRMSYATWLWCVGKKDDAVEQVLEFRKLDVANEMGAVVASRMLVEVNRTDEARQLLDALSPTDARLLEYCEMTLMNLGLKHENKERARKAAERLYAMPLDSATQMQVSEAMEQLGMNEMSEAIVQRVRRLGVTDIPTMHQLMLRLKKSNVPDEKAAAVDLAMKIYQRTTNNSRSLMAGIQPAGQTGDVRSDSIRLLVESGESARLVKSLEERLARPPKNATLAYQLAELYRAMGKSTQADELLKPFVRNTLTVSPRVILSEEEMLAQDAKARVALLDNVLTNGAIEGIERLKNELFSSASGQEQLSIHAKVTSQLLGTDAVDRRNAKGKLQEWLGRVAATSEGKEKLKQFVTQLEANAPREITIPQLVTLVCYADAADDQELALRIAKSILTHRNAAYSVASLAGPGRETTWAIVPMAVKHGDADLATKLAQIALKPSSDESAEALQLQLDLALLQFELNKVPEAEVTLRDVMTKLNRPHEKELQSRGETAIRIAKLAADRSLIEVSCEAALRASSLSSTGSKKMNEDLLKLIQNWQSKQASPERIYNTVKEVVFRKNDPNRWRLYPEPRRNYGGSHDFTFPELEPKPLALVLVDLAKANDSLPSLVQDLDSFAAQPALRNVMYAMKVYSQRALGNTAEAAKIVEEVIEAPKTVPDEILLLYAFTTPVPGDDAKTVMPPEVAGTLLTKFLNERIMHTGTRIAMLSQIKACIAADDRVMLDNFVAAAADAIPKVPNYEKESLKLMLTQFYKYLAGECTAQGKSELAAEYMKRAEAK